MTRSARRSPSGADSVASGADAGSQSIACDDSRAAECALAAVPDAASTARAFTRSTLRQWARGHLIDDALLVVSELVTNAVQHGVPDTFESDEAGDAARPILLRLVDQATSVMCIVHDPSSAPPDLKSAGVLAESCRGLHIVAELSSVWGWTPLDPHGKAVWAELDAERQPVEVFVLGDAVPTTAVS